MGDGPVALTLVELSVTTMDGLAAPKSGHVDLERPGAGRSPPEDVRPPGLQRERHRPIPSVTQQQRGRRVDTPHGTPATFVTNFRVGAKHGAAARIEAVQSADGWRLH